MKHIKVQDVSFCNVVLTIGVRYYEATSMQCVILAGGEGKRMRPLTDTVPKPLVEVAGAPLLDHIVRALPMAVSELVIVTGYMREKIEAHCGSEYFGRPVTYVHQREQKGTGHALALCAEHVHGRFLYLFADDLHDAKDLARLVSFRRGMLVSYTTTPERFGVVVRRPNGTLGSFVEKPQDEIPSSFASTGVFVLDEDVFKYKAETEVHGEYYHTESILAYAKDHPIAVVEEEGWLPVGYPEDLEKVAAYLGGVA